MSKRLRHILAIATLFITPLSADPWGKDADLAACPRSARCCEERCRTPFLGAFGETMIQFHQDVISPADGPRSHFKPSSSQYTLDAMRKYGFFQGVAMGCDRLMRENNEQWVYRETIGNDGCLIKYDPVP